MVDVALFMMRSAPSQATPRAATAANAPNIAAVLATNRIREDAALPARTLARERVVQKAMNIPSTARLSMPPRDSAAIVAMIIMAPAKPYASLWSAGIARVRIRAAGNGASISIYTAKWSRVAKGPKPLRERVGRNQ